MSVYPVVLCGGAGTRLWPASRPWRPKQFLPLIGERSSFQETLLRLEGLKDVATILVVAGAEHAATVRRQLGEIGVRAVILAEPQGRDSAPAIAAAVTWIAERDREGLAVNLASDHHVGDAAAFRGALTTALAGAAQGHIVILGVAPDCASSAYGYIVPGDAIGQGGLRRVGRFAEKPAPAAARALIDAGGLWNCSYFVARAATLAHEFARHAPEVLAAARLALAKAKAVDGVIRLGAEFTTAPKISIDYAVMEKTALAAVLPVSFPWSDLGAWDAVWAASPTDAAGNAVTGEAILEGSRDCLVRAAPGQILAVVGARRLAVIAEADAILVCDLDASQAVKAVAAKAAGASPPQPPDSLHDQAAWLRRWLTVNALPAWWTLGADRARGGFHDALDQEGRPLEGPRRARVQARQSFVYAQAGPMGWTGPWREALDHGADYLRRRFTRPDGLVRTLVNPNGEPADDTAFLYDQAFALLALAAEGGEREDEARSLMGAIERAFRHAGGGFAETGAERFVSNPLMHLFEAVLAWLEVGGGGEGAAGWWRALAEELAALALDRLIDPAGGWIAETYDAAWLPNRARGGVWPGHQFEWAWLMVRWRRLSGAEPALAAAARLYDAGARGVTATGVTANAMDPDLRITDAAGRLWPQTERLKAAVGLAGLSTGERRRRLEADARQAAAVLRRYLAAPAAGLWFDRIDADDQIVPGPAPASSFYHLIGAVRALAWPAAEANTSQSIPRPRAKQRGRG